MNPFSVLALGIGVALLYYHVYRKDRSTDQLMQPRIMANPIAQFRSLMPGFQGGEQKAMKVESSRPVKLSAPISGKCSTCGNNVSLPFRCKYCGDLFCVDHRLPECHDCNST